MDNINIFEKYWTKDGRPVRILCTNRKHHLYPVVGLVYTLDTDEEQEPHTWTIDGRSCVDTPTSLDLVPARRAKDLEIDDKVLYKEHNESNWTPGHFAGVTKSGCPMVFKNNASSWTSNGKNNLCSRYFDSSRL